MAKNQLESVVNETLKRNQTSFEVEFHTLNSSSCKKL